MGEIRSAEKRNRDFTTDDFRVRRGVEFLHYRLLLEMIGPSPPINRNMGGREFRRENSDSALVIEL